MNNMGLIHKHYIGLKLILFSAIVAKSNAVPEPLLYETHRAGIRNTEAGSNEVAIPEEFSEDFNHSYPDGTFDENGNHIFTYEELNSGLPPVALKGSVNKPLNYSVLVKQFALALDVFAEIANSTLEMSEEQMEKTLDRVASRFEINNRILRKNAFTRFSGHVKHKLRWLAIKTRFFPSAKRRQALFQAKFLKSGLRYVIHSILKEKLKRQIRGQKRASTVMENMAMGFTSRQSTPDQPPQHHDYTEENPKHYNHSNQGHVSHEYHGDHSPLENEMVEALPPVAVETLHDLLQKKFLDTVVNIFQDSEQFHEIHMNSVDHYPLPEPLDNAYTLKSSAFYGQNVTCTPYHSPGSESDVGAFAFPPMYALNYTFMAGVTQKINLPFNETNFLGILKDPALDEVRGLIPGGGVQFIAVTSHALKCDNGRDVPLGFHLFLNGAGMLRALEQVNSFVEGITAAENTPRNENSEGDYLDYEKNITFVISVSFDKVSNVLYRLQKILVAASKVSHEYAETDDFEEVDYTVAGSQDERSDLQGPSGGKGENSISHLYFGQNILRKTHQQENLSYTERVEDHLSEKDRMLIDGLISDLLDMNIAFLSNRRDEFSKEIMKLASIVRALAVFQLAENFDLEPIDKTCAKARLHLRKFTKGGLEADFEYKGANCSMNLEPIDKDNIPEHLRDMKSRIHDRQGFSKLDNGTSYGAIANPVYCRGSKVVAPKYFSLGLTEEKALQAAMFNGSQSCEYVVHPKDVVETLFGGMQHDGNHTSEESHLYQNETINNSTGAQSNATDQNGHGGNGKEIENALTSSPSTTTASTASLSTSMATTTTLSKTTTTKPPQTTSSQTTASANETDSSSTPTPGANSSSQSGNDTCFPATETVELQGGKIIPMKFLSIGDIVRVGADAFSTVILFSHADPEVVTNFVKLTTSRGKSIHLSPSHYIYINGKLAAAKSAHVGDKLTSGLTSEKQLIITNISRVYMTGLYNPQTTHGDIVVNGFLASTFTTAVPIELATVALSPLRFLDKLFGVTLPIVSNFFSNGWSWGVAFIPYGPESIDL